MSSRRISSLFLTTIAARVSTNNALAFTINSISRRASFAVQQQVQQVRTARPYSSSKSALFAAVPEPGPCPECSDDNAYWDGASNFACTACGHEWPVDSQDEQASAEDDGDGIVRDVNGVPIEAGDTVLLTQALGKGLKKGMKILKIRVGDYGDGHDCQANIPGLGTFNLKSQFLKKQG
jgi:protein PhnA